MISLERHITRQQIESLESAPDVLTIRDGVGSGGFYTLVVSSNVGREFVIDRLRRKLARIVGKEGEPVDRSVAAGVYETTRDIAPRLALQATGISRVTEEILGLMVARNVADQHFCRVPRNGVIVWISLDDHPEWFRGAGSTRADLLRVAFERGENGLEVGILVVEGKLRTVYDPHGVEQVRATMNLIRDMLPEADKHDGRYWRVKLLSAVEAVAREARCYRGAAREEVDERSVLPADIYNTFRDGEFTVTDFRGLFVLSKYDTDSELVIEEEPDAGITVARVFRRHILDLVRNRPGSVPSVEPGADSEHPLGGGENGSGGTGGDTTEPVPMPPSTAGARQAQNPPHERRAGLSQQLGKLGTDELKSRYQIILDRYAEFNVKVLQAEVSQRVIEGPASVLYRVRPGAGVDPRRISEKGDTLKLALGLQEEQHIRFSFGDGYVNIDVPKDEADRYYVDAEKLWEVWQRPGNALETPIGVDRYGDIVALNFSSPNNPHLLIGGTTGSGKSEALNTILQGLVRHYDPSELRLRLVDPKGTELEGFSESSHLDGEVGWDDNDALSMLEHCVREMQRRYQVFREAKRRSLPEYNEANPDSRLPWWVVVLDEYADLTSDPDAKKAIEQHLKRLAQKARAAGIHVIIATQKPSAEVISTNLRSNLPAQLALGVKSATESRVVMGEQGAETLNGKGDAFLKAGGQLRRVQCARVTDH